MKLRRKSILEELFKFQGGGLTVFDSDPRRDFDFGQRPDFEIDPFRTQIGSIPTLNAQPVNQAIQFGIRQDLAERTFAEQQEQFDLNYNIKVYDKVFGSLGGNGTSSKGGASKQIGFGVLDKYNLNHLDPEDALLAEQVRKSDEEFSEGMAAMLASGDMSQVSSLMQKRNATISSPQVQRRAAGNLVIAQLEQMVKEQTSSSGANKGNLLNAKELERRVQRGRELKSSPTATQEDFYALLNGDNLYYKTEDVEKEISGTIDLVVDGTTQDLVGFVTGQHGETNHAMVSKVRNTDLTNPQEMRALVASMLWEKDGVRAYAEANGMTNLREFHDNMIKDHFDLKAGAIGPEVELGKETNLTLEEKLTPGVPTALLNIDEDGTPILNNRDEVVDRNVSEAKRKAEVAAKARIGEAREKAKIEINKDRIKQSDKDKISKKNPFKEGSKEAILHDDLIAVGVDLKPSEVQALLGFDENIQVGGITDILELSNLLDTTLKEDGTEYSKEEIIAELEKQFPRLMFKLDENGDIIEGEVSPIRGILENGFERTRNAKALEKVTGELGSGASGGVPKSVFDYMSTNEAGVGGYSSLFGNVEQEGGKFSNIDVTRMTIEDVLTFTDRDGEYAEHTRQINPESWTGDKAGEGELKPHIDTRPEGMSFNKALKSGDYSYPSTPVGNYQIVGSTLVDIVDGFEIDKTQLFTPAVQDEIFMKFAQKTLKQFKGDQAQDKKRNWMKDTWESMDEDSKAGRLSNRQLDLMISDIEKGGKVLGDKKEGEINSTDKISKYYGNTSSNSSKTTGDPIPTKTTISKQEFDLDRTLSNLERAPRNLTTSETLEKVDEIKRLEALRQTYLSGERSDPFNQKEGLGITIDKLKGELDKDLKSGKGAEINYEAELNDPENAATVANLVQDIGGVEAFLNLKKGEFIETPLGRLYVDDNGGLTWSKKDAESGDNTTFPDTENLLRLLLRKLARKKSGLDK